MLYKCFYFLIIINGLFSFKNRIILPNNLNLNLKSKDMINYLTSIKDYTIIANSDDYKNLEEVMVKNNMNVYYINLNNITNITDKNEIFYLLKKKYNNIESGEDLWIFYKGFFIGSKTEIDKIIKKNNFTLSFPDDTEL